MASAGKDAAWKGRVEQIEELAQTDPVLGQRLRAARSLELLKAHDSRERDSESDFAAAMMRREKEDLLRINARVRQVRCWHARTFSPASHLRRTGLPWQTRAKPTEARRRSCLAGPP